VTPAVVVAAAILVALAVWLVMRARRRRRGANRTIGIPVAADPIGAGLGGTRQHLARRIAGLFGGAPDTERWEDLEEALLSVDMGVEAAGWTVERVRAARPSDAGELRAALRRELVAVFTGRERGLRLTGSPAVVLVVGVNGSGKTTTVARLAALLQREGHRPLLAAADTFRAGAGEQLSVWADRLGVDLVVGQPGADPSSVAFDGYSACRARGGDVLLVDTAGRLHSKHNLMQELGKVVRVLERAAGRVDEVLLVVDGTTGQNSLAQARIFAEVVGVTGAVITKLDGSARGGIAVAVENELGLPVKFIGVGEGVGDLVPFRPGEFVDALLGIGEGGGYGGGDG
jgi:fused signal recognition particle receptor